ncbi:hypothetical protein PTI45_03083 [Paenibacillus nuruki]|uniref:Rhodanese domain-containing protein n=1 Tax=Paenibacillus nuruki TaxID=1886670 RepID=A0A1E3L1P3_9BACL|nr:rhodanese-like domain-containing protein [Paenibacillus nuruki]ODP27521.1 hypothetical protein PTI45_03083 [Paenibacillus nuruki]
MRYAVVLIFVLIYWWIQHVRFLNSVTLLSVTSNSVKIPSTTKYLDIRDYTAFEKEHIPESIGIYLGRLPFVWRKANLNPKDSILILTDNYFKGKKAVRILRKQGFRDLYLVVGSVSELMKWSQKNK